MNYKELLKKYIRYVEHHEGITFIDMPLGKQNSTRFLADDNIDDITEEDIEKLRNLIHEINDELQTKDK